MPGPSAFDYAVVRVVPRVDRDELVNVGVVLFCAEQGFLGCALALDEPRLRALAPEVDAAAVARHLDGIRAICAGDPAAGPIAALTASERFHWLSAPRSTVVQTSPVHPGRCDDPAAALERLFRATVDGADRAHRR
jgi:hypothetical protein